MNNSTEALLLQVAALLRFVALLDELIDVRAATAYDPRYGIPNAIEALHLIEDLGDRANPVTARCMFIAARSRIDQAAEAAGVRRAPTSSGRGEAVPMRRWTLVFTVGVETFEQEVNAINLTSAWDAAFHTIDVVTGDGDDPESIRLDEHRVSVHICDECQASVRRNRTMISPDHTETCSLHPSNVI